MASLLNMYYSVTRKPADHWLGYSVAISGALMQMMSYGIDNSFSSFSNSMQNDPTLGFPSATAVSFGNSVSLGLSPVFGVVAGFMVDRLPPRFMMLLSTALLFLGLWICSTWAHSMVAVAFSYCLLASISSACMLSPGAAATGSWFRKRLGLAQGINFCGGGVGSAVIPAVLGSWIEPYGWRKTFRLMSAFCAIGLLASIFSCRRGEPRDEEEEAEEEAAAAETANVEDVELSVGLSHHTPAGGVEPTDMSLDVRPVAAIADDEERDVHGGFSCSGEGAERDSGDSYSSSSPVVAAGDADPFNEKKVGTQRKAMTRHEELMHAMHTRRLRPLEILRVMLTTEFLANFFMFAIYGWAFYGMIYVTFPYVSSMGTAGTVYQHLTPISTSKASTTFTFWGVFQIFGSILVGALASATANNFAYCLCSGVGGIATASLAFCRNYASFASCLSVIGFCTAGIFAVMPALLVDAFYGPNLGFFMACVFVAGCLGGFSAPPIQAELQTRHDGNYSYGCIFISCCMTMPGVLCYLLLWPGKKNKAVRRVESLANKLAAKVLPDA